MDNTILGRPLISRAGMMDGAAEKLVTKLVFRVLLLIMRGFPSQKPDTLNHVKGQKDVVVLKTPIWIT